MRLHPDLVVDSATGVDVALPMAGPGARSFAFLIDWLIRTILAIAWYVVGALLYNRGWRITAPMNPGAAWFVYVIAPPAAIYFLYHPILEVLTRGRTPGKRMAGVQLVARDGGAPSVGALLTRNVFRLVDSFPAAYAVGLITTFVTRDSVRIGDLAAGTLLVYVEINIVGEPTVDRRHPTALLQRLRAWKEVSARVRRLSQKRSEDAADAAAMADGYRLLAHDLARVRRSQPDSDTRDYLEAAYAQ